MALAPDARLGPGWRRCWSSGETPSSGWVASAGLLTAQVALSRYPFPLAGSLSKAHHSLKKLIVLHTCTKHCFKRSFLPSLPYFFYLAFWYDTASSYLRNHGNWIILYNCCILVILHTFFSLFALSVSLLRLPAQLTAVVSNGITEGGQDKHLGYSSPCLLGGWTVAKIQIWGILDFLCPLPLQFIQIPVCIPIDFSINNVNQFCETMRIH